jgi:hypothetical protein
LNRYRLGSTLVNRSLPDGVVSLSPTMRVRGCQPVHEGRSLGIRFGPQQEMKMRRHRAETEKPDGVFCERLEKDVLESVVLRRGLED